MGVVKVGTGLGEDLRLTMLDNLDILNSKDGKIIFFLSRFFFPVHNQFIKWVPNPQNNPITLGKKIHFVDLW